MAIAAHETGHAIQWAKKSVFIRMRDSVAVPVQIATQIGQMMFSMSLFILLFSMGSGIEKWFEWTTIAGLFIYAAMGVFQLITLPVEFGASRKANSVGHGIVLSLLKGGVVSSQYNVPFKGEVFLVNPNKRIASSKRREPKASTLAVYSGESKLTATWDWAPKL